MLKASLRFCELKKVDLEMLKLQSYVNIWLNVVEQDQLSSSSMQRHLTSIRQFMKWAEQGKYLEINPTDDF